MAGTHIERARELLPIVNKHAAASERAGHLVPEVAEALFASGLTRLMVLPELGGAGLGVPEVVETSQLIASADASTGWNYLFVALSPAFGHMLPKESYLEIFSDPRGGIAGVLNPTMRAVAEDGGYRFSGRSQYNSAHVLSTHIMAAGIVMRDGAVSMRGPMPEMRVGVLPKSRVTLFDNWDSSGLRATGSDDAEIDGQFIPESMTFAFPGAMSAWQTPPWNRLPIPVALGPTIASVIVGAARGAIDAFRAVAADKVPAQKTARLAEQPGAQLALAEAEGLWLAANAVLHNGVRELWATGTAGAPSMEDFARARLSSVTAARLARRAAEMVRDHVGMNGMLPGNPIERFCRDLDAAMQHITVAPSRFEATGRVLMGLDPGSPFV
jgi:alkylation response protein AidB-like acyl-CoA dehydrogenase